MHFEENCQKQFKIKQMLLVAFTLLFALFASAFAYASQVKEIEIDNKGTKTTVKTMGKSVAEVLKENSIIIKNDEVVSPNVWESLGHVNQIEISKKPVIVQVAVAKPVVDEEKDIKPKQIILKDKIKISEKVIKVNGKIPFKVEKKANSRLLKGETKTIKQGKQGVVEKQYKVVYRNGKEVSRKLLASNIVKKPSNKIIEYGTISMLMTSRGEAVRFKKSIVMKSTAYDNSFKSTGKKPGSAGFGVTASGMRTKKGVVAVDPRVIPLGTRLFVESMQNGVPSYGYAIAGDTGGAIKGNKIDLFFPTTREVYNWGVRKVKVYILE